MMKWIKQLFCKHHYMRETYEFLKKCGVFYLATVENDQPRVRPFGAINIYEDKLYIATHPDAVCPLGEHLRKSHFLVERKMIQ